MNNDTPDTANPHPTAIEPRIIAEVGGLVDLTRVWLGLYGQDLDPDEVSGALGVRPTSSHRRGESRRSAPVWPQGAWLLMIERSAPEGPAEVLGMLLDQLPSNPDVWQQLRAKHTVRVTFGLHIEAWNRGFDLPPALVGRLASTGAIVGFDIYCHGDEASTDVT